MTFDEYDRDSRIGRIGYQFEGTAGRIPPVRPHRLQRRERGRPGVRPCRPGQQNGHFVMPGYQPADNWWTAEVGVGFQLTDNLEGHVAYSGLFADDTQDRHTLNSACNGTSARSGGRGAGCRRNRPDCSALDDDGDGINNCNDACPGSAAGQPSVPMAARCLPWSRSRSRRRSETNAATNRRNNHAAFGRRGFLCPCGSRYSAMLYEPSR